MGSDDKDASISHFIPSVELTGSRQEKLRKLDTLIVYLEQLRRRLSQGVGEGIMTGRDPDTGRPWHWLVAGIVIGAVCGLLIVAAHRSGL